MTLSKRRKRGRNALRSCRPGHGGVVYLDRLAVRRDFRDDGDDVRGPLELYDRAVRCAARQVLPRCQRQAKGEM